MAKSKAVLAMEVLMAEREAECVAKLEAMQLRLDKAVEIFKAQKAEIAILKAQKPGAKTPVITYYVDNEGVQWKKVRIGNDATATPVVAE